MRVYFTLGRSPVEKKTEAQHIARSAGRLSKLNDKLSVKRNGDVVYVVIHCLLIPLMYVHFSFFSFL